MALPELWNGDDSLNERAQAAIHEAGHAVMLCRWHWVLGLDVGDVYIREEMIDSLGEMRYVGRCRGVGHLEKPEETQLIFKHNPSCFQQWRTYARRHKAAALLSYAGLMAEEMAGVDDAEFLYGLNGEWGPRNDVYNFENRVSVLCFLARDEAESTFSRYQDRLRSLTWLTLKKE